MAFPPAFLDDIRDRVSVSEVVARKVKLGKRGREFVGLCPFHSEKTPSFTVSDEKGFFHCFGCGAHGDVIGFLMRGEGLPFPDAVEKLAALAGLPVPETSPADRAEAHRRATFLDALEAAARWFEDQLRGAAGRPALAYLAERGLDEETIARFRLGFAPDARGALKSALVAAGMPEALLLECGLVGRGEAGDTYDRFRGRVMFPIADRRGRVVAFGGRALSGGEPKYLNSPETPLFHKGRLLYGLAQARQAAHERGEAIAAEGYMDVIALSQAGFRQAVAPLGTALTEDQIALLWQLAPEPILCFDGDAAGERAAARAALRALPMLQPGRSLRFALLPPGDDPDSLVRRTGPAALRDILDRARPLVDMLWDMEVGARPPDTPERRAGLRRRLAELVSTIADRTVAEAYRQEMWRRFEAAFGFAAARGPRQPRPAHRSLLGGQAARQGIQGLERGQQEALLAVLVNHPDLLGEHLEELARLSLSVGELDRLRRAIIDLAAVHPELDAPALQYHLDKQGFSGTLAALAARTKVQSPLQPAAGRKVAGEFLRHVIGLRREREAMAEVPAAARRLAEQPSDEALASLERAQRSIQRGESRRRDIDRDGVSVAGKDE